MNSVADSRVDHSSLSNCEDVLWKSLDLKLAVDFETSTLKGSAFITAEVSFY